MTRFGFFYVLELFMRSVFFFFCKIHYTWKILKYCNGFELEGCFLYMDKITFMNELSILIDL